jgi:hypothetical protein
MRFGKSPAMPIALAAVLGLGLGLASPAHADGMLFQDTIPRSVVAYDYTTGSQYMAPPIPYGHYAKDYIADADKALGCVSCKLHGLAGGGGLGHGMFHHGQGDGNCGGDGCAGGNGCGHGSGKCTGIFGHNGGSACGVAGCGGGMTCGLLGHGGHSVGSAGYACTGTLPTGQALTQPSAQSVCGQTGCNVKSRHSHFGHASSANGCGHGSAGTGGFCGDPGCGSGHGLGHGKGTGCGLCGGKGCSHCLSGLGSGLGSMLHGKLASMTGALHRPKISWFLGAGGPVPLTPGYVPYVVTTRSPRDYFAFAPMNPND